MRLAPRQISWRHSLLLSTGGIFFGLIAILISGIDGYRGILPLWAAIPLTLLGTCLIVVWVRLGEVTLEDDTFIVRTWLKTERLPASQLTGYSKPPTPRQMMWTLSFGSKTVRFVGPTNPDELEQLLKELPPVSPAVEHPKTT